MNCPQGHTSKKLTHTKHIFVKKQIEFIGKYPASKSSHQGSKRAAKRSSLSCNTHCIHRILFSEKKKKKEKEMARSIVNVEICAQLPSQLFIS